MHAYTYSSSTGACRAAFDQPACLVNPNLEREEGWWVAYGAQAELAQFPVESEHLPTWAESPCASQRWGSSNSTLLTFVTRHSFCLVLFCTVLRCCCSLVAPLYDITVTRSWEGLFRVCPNTVSALLYRTGTAHPFFFFLFLSPDCRKSHFSDQSLQSCAYLKDDFSVLLRFLPAYCILFVSQVRFFKKKWIYKSRPPCCGAERGAACSRGQTAITELLKPCLWERDVLIMLQPRLSATPWP